MQRFDILLLSILLHTSSKIISHFYLAGNSIQFHQVPNKTTYHLLTTLKCNKRKPIFFGGGKFGRLPNAGICLHYHGAFVGFLANYRVKQMSITLFTFHISNCKQSNSEPLGTGFIACFLIEIILSKVEELLHYCSKLYHIC